MEKAQDEKHIQDLRNDYAFHINAYHCGGGGAWAIEHYQLAQDARIVLEELYGVEV